jgi:short-subunit dehydrogenase
MTRLQGATVLVTGATGGVGQAIARSLRAEGCQLVVSGRREDPLRRLAEDVSGRFVVADLAERADVERLIVQAGDVDVLVANAALPASGDLEGWAQEDIDRALEVNLASPIAMTRALLPGFRRRGQGHFVFISSLSGKVGSKGTSVYSATKFGLRGFSSGLRCDLHGSGIGASVILPGFVRDAGMFADTGVSLPPGVGTVSPGRVAAAVIRAIRHDKAEVTVAPLAMRLASTAGALVPQLSTVVQSRLGGDLADRIARAQSHRR